MKDAKVLLNWETASELNNDHFSIERSADRISFEEIMRQEGADTSKSFS